MIEIVIMTALYGLLMAAKKNTKPVFGQMTLTGEKALDWVKPDSRITAKRIEMGAAALFDEFNMPEWAKEKGLVALIWPNDEWGNPMLVTQKSILKVIEAKCCEFEAAGATVEMQKRKMGHVACIEFEENEPTFEFIRPKNAKQFDPYKVAVL